MGIENRDYYRRSSDYAGQFGSWGGGTSAWPPGVKYLIIANVIVFLLQMFISRPVTEAEFLQQTQIEQDEWDSYPQRERMLYLSQMPHVSLITEAFQLQTEKVLRGQIWRIVTCAFCHSMGIFHILFNMLFLFWFGKTLELMYGTREFLLFYFTAAIASSLAYIGLDLYTGDMIPAIGASGAVMGVVMLYAIHYPRHTIRVYFFIPVEIRWVVLLYVLYDLHPVLLALSGNKQHTGIAHAAHLGGLAFGFLYWKMNWRLEHVWNKLRLPRFGRTVGARGNVRLHQPSVDRPASSRGSTTRPSNVRREQSESAVDDILRKISQSGRESLTEQEEETLKQASEKYRDRRK